MKILKQKKGISTIIAVLLMIVITVAAAVITYIWVMGYIGGTMTGVKTATTQSSITIDDAYNITKFVYVLVRNVGSTNATVSSIYIGTSSSNLANAGTIAGTNKIAPLTMQSLNVTYTSLKKGTTYVVKVVDTDGGSAIGTLSC